MLLWHLAGLKPSLKSLRSQDFPVYLEKNIQRLGKVAKVSHNIEVTWKAIAGSHTWLAVLGLAKGFQMAMTGECSVT